MAYITAIKFAIFVFPILAILLTLPYIIVQYARYGSVSFLRSLILFTFIFYMLCAYFLVIMPLPHRSEVGPGRQINLEPFRFWRIFREQTVLDIHDPSTYIPALRQPCLNVVLFNVLMTMPFGMYMKYYFRQNLVTTTVLTFGLSAFFEFTQYTGLYFIYEGTYRLCDVDDLIQNTTGGILGYILMCILRWALPLPTRENIDKDAYRKGVRVSGLRRSVMSAFDMLLFGVILAAALHQAGRWHMLVAAGTFLIYFVIWPAIFRGRTPGCLVLRLEPTAPGHMYIRLFLRNIYIVIYFILAPAYVAQYLLIGTKELETSHENKILALGVVVMAIFLFYLIHAIGLWTTRRMYYDSWFKIAFASTIRVPGVTASPEDASGYVQDRDGWLVKPGRKDS